MDFKRMDVTRQYHADLGAEALAASTNEAETAAALFLLWMSVDTVAEFQTRVIDAIEISTQEMESMMSYIELGMIGEASLALGAIEHKTK